MTLEEDIDDDSGCGGNCNRGRYHNCDNCEYGTYSSYYGGVSHYFEFGFSEYAHDILKNAALGAGVYSFSGSDSAGIATAGALSALDTLLLMRDLPFREAYHFTKDFALGSCLPLSILKNFDPNFNLKNIYHAIAADSAFATVAASAMIALSGWFGIGSSRCVRDLAKELD